VIRGSCGLQWVVQRQDGSRGGVPIWGKNPLAFCATREGLLLRLKEVLLEEHLTKLGFYRPKREEVFDTKRNRLVVRDQVSQEALEETEAARDRLKRGDVAAFGVDPAAWAAIEALPDYFNAGSDSA
jgi:hypothetical protein